MAKRAYLKNTATGEEYLIVSVNKETKKCVLQNKEGQKFEEDFVPDLLKKLGYAMVQKEVENV